MNKTWFQKLFRHDPPADSGRKKTGPFPDNADMQFALSQVQKSTAFCQLTKTTG